jgi:hypothetical protein
VYLDDAVKVELTRVAELTGLSEAELIRQGISLVLGQHEGGRSRITQTFENGSLVSSIDELMEGFGR